MSRLLDSGDRPDMLPAEPGGLLRILVIEDEAGIADFLKLGLRYEGFEVDLAADGQAGLESFCHNRPDLVILDLMLPHLDGWQVCRQLRAQSDVPVVMLTARDEVSDRVRGLDLGADDYVTKPFSLEELLARVRAVLRRHGKALKASVLRFMDINLRTDTREVTRRGNPIPLTAKEFELLYLFMTHPHQVLSKESMLNRVWGYDYFGDSNAVEVYVGHLRRKLGEPPVIQTLRGAGYALRAEQ